MRTPHAIIVARARAFRAAPTTTEAILWQVLRGRRLGVRFERQVVLGRFIADFCARSAKLVVEVDVRCTSTASPRTRDGTGTLLAWATASCACRVTWCSTGSARRWRASSRRSPSAACSRHQARASSPPPAARVVTAWLSVGGPSNDGWVVLLAAPRRLVRHQDGLSLLPARRLKAPVDANAAAASVILAVRRSSCSLPSFSV